MVFEAQQLLWAEKQNREKQNVTLPVSGIGGEIRNNCRLLQSTEPSNFLLTYYFQAWICLLSQKWHVNMHGLHVALMASFCPQGIEITVGPDQGQKGVSVKKNSGCLIPLLFLFGFTCQKMKTMESLRMQPDIEGNTDFHQEKKGD